VNVAVGYPRSRMTNRLAACAALAFAACGEPPAAGRVVVAITVDWEGAYFSSEGLDALADIRTAAGDAPITHFLSAGYFTKRDADAPAAYLREAIRKDDELAIHLHLWQSLARAAGVEPKVSPSFLSGTDKLTEFPDGDMGFETDVDVYEASELRAMLRTSRRMLEQTGHRVSTSFRAAGYLGTPRLLQAIRDESFTVDSSAVDHRPIVDPGGTVFAARVAEVWPGVTPSTRPFAIELRGGSLLELPIAAVVDYVAADEVVAVIDAARATLEDDPDRGDVVVVLALHHETGAEFGPRLREALERLRARGAQLAFETVERAARTHLHGR
jgi:hypothetical protein